MGRKAVFAFVTAVGISFIGGTALAQVGFRATPLLQGTRTVIGQEIQFPLFRNQISALLVEIAPGGETGRHQHPVPTFVYVLEGTVTIAHEGHPQHVATAGQSFLESVNTWHNGRNLGTTPLKLLVVFSGEEGKPNLVRP
ncbi:MAG: cupin domain-containing protein [Nitrospiraceae bacterium]